MQGAPGAWAGTGQPRPWGALDPPPALGSSPQRAGTQPKAALRHPRPLPRLTSVLLLAAVLPSELGGWRAAAAGWEPSSEGSAATSNRSICVRFHLCTGGVWLKGG